MPFSERDVHLIIAELVATCGRMRELIQDRELASSHKLEQIRRARMFEKQVARKRASGFDRIKIIAEMHEHTLRRLHAGFDSELFYTGLYSSRWPPTAETFTVDMDVEVGRLRLEVPLSKLPPPPQYDLSPRRSPAAGTRLDEPGVPQTEIQQTEQEGTFPFQAGVDDFLCLETVRGSRNRRGLHLVKQTSGQTPKQLQNKLPLARSLLNYRGAGSSEGPPRQGKTSSSTRAGNE